MSLNLPHICHQLPLPSQHHTQRNLSILHHRAWKRRKLKKLKLQSLRRLPSHICSSCFAFNFDPSPFENLYHGLISLFASPSSVDLVVPALGLASGAAIYFSRLQKNSRPLNTSNRRRYRLVGDWILFTSPTPFNRFVVLRCPSISFEGSDLLEDVNEKLVEEDRHFVRLNSGRIQAKEAEVDEKVEKLVYQRVCVGTDDGGVFSLDWPANLDMEEERGLDTTILIVPGTPEGSLENDIKVFVCECLRRGCFPVVMNPRGCAGSPIITARLFTAADSDDISTAIKFVNKARPWTMLMGVGWGYGANMLTKHLAEVGEKTSLTAVTCIDNPFDLDEATRCSPYCLSLDQKLTNGLKEILRSNKELFQGRAKRFDVENALLATSVRDFEKAISMVSYGCNEITDFYSNSSTQGMIGEVKIPVLFIQNDNGAVPLYSIPRSSIAENPFTSLLLCSYLPSGEHTCSRSTLSWCQHVCIEWLAAVELGLLKGRHPLLKDVDVTVTPKNGVALVENRATKEKVKTNSLFNLHNQAASDFISPSPSREMLEENGAVAYLYSRSKNESNGGLKHESNESQPKDYNSLEQSNAVDAELVEDEVANTVDGDRGQVLQTAKVVMNMLDVTLPDTLTDEQKNKVLTAVGKGETLMTALQNAVPADVREKLTMSVSEILHNQDSNLKFDRFLSLEQIPGVASTLGSKGKENNEEIPSPSRGNGDLDALVAKKRADDIPNGSNTHQSSEDKTAVGQESDYQAMENGNNPNDLDQVQSKESHRSDVSDSVKDVNDVRNSRDDVDSSKEKTNVVADRREDEQETVGKPELPSNEGDDNAENRFLDPHKEEEGVKSQTTVKVETIHPDSSLDQTNSSPFTPDDKLPISVSHSDVELTEKEGNDNFKREESTVLPGLTDAGSKLPNFSVSQALDALTGMDDSTQLAVNSVFNVLEDMITQLEEGKDRVKDEKNADDAEVENNKSETEQRDHVLYGEGSLAFENQPNKNSYQKMPHESGNGNSISSTWPNDDAHSSKINSEEISTGDPVLCNGDVSHFAQKTDAITMAVEENVVENCMADGTLALEKSSECLNSASQRLLINASTNLYRDPPFRFLQKFLISKMRHTEALDLDTITALFLDYFPEEGQWKLLEQTGDNNESSDDSARHLHVGSNVETDSNSLPEDAIDVIEPSYVIVDSEKYREHINGKKTYKPNRHVKKAAETDFLLFVKGIVLDTLRVEVGQRLSMSDTNEMQPELVEDLDLIANSVGLSISSEEENLFSMEHKDRTLEKFGTLEEENIARAIYLAFQDTSYLRRVLPVGIIIGSCLASLRQYFDVDKANSDSQSEEVLLHKSTTGETVEIAFDKLDNKHDLDGSVDKIAEIIGTESSRSNTVMVGAAAAALGASALLIKQRNAENESKPDEEKDGHYNGQKNGEVVSDKTQNNIVTSLAAKAMSVTAPVVPTKEDGELDHERLVTMLVELGQKGGILKLVGKLALLWGGIRGALSLTDKLISFLRLAERPLFHRMLGFTCMVLLLWSPIAVPLFPTLVQGWASHNTSRIPELACIIGFYISVMLMVKLWGKRIRGYDNPLEQYGLDTDSPFKLQNYVKGLTGGVVLVFLIHTGNYLCGFVRPTWPAYLAVKPSNAATWIQVSGKVLLLAIRGLVMATSVAIVEELLFRSWLPDEIAADYGYYHGIIISGLAFSLSQRSVWAIPGLGLLSVALTGARQRSHGSLFVPIGLRAGMLWSCFILQAGGFLAYETKVPIWLRGGDLYQPFSGVFGLAFSILLALMLYPEQPLHERKMTRAIKE